MRTNNGIAIVTALLIMVVVGLLATGGALVTRMELNIARNDASSLQAHYAAQAGLQKYKTVLFQYFRYLETLPPGENPTRTACFDRMGDGIDLNRDGTEEYPWTGGKITFPEETVENSLSEVVGRYTVTIYRDTGNNHIFTIESKGWSNGARATVRSTLLVENTGVLENAIFTGQGQANQQLNGGAIINGGVYVVGTEDDPSTYEDESDNVVIGAKGNFEMNNRYNLDGTDFEGHITTENLVADNLCASLRVDNGKVDLNGSVLIGDPDNWLLGVYIGDEPDDLVISETLDRCTENKGICSEIGRFTLDLTEGGSPKFPELSDAPDPKAECSASTWSGCIEAEAMSNGLKVSRASFSGSPLYVFDNPSSGLDPACETFLTSDGNLTDNVHELVFDTSTIDCTYEDPIGIKHGFKYNWKADQGDATLEVYGTVSLTGYDVKFARPTEYIAQTMTTTETVWNASFVVEKNSDGTGGDIDIMGDFVPSNDTYGDPLFPYHVLGLVAEDDILQEGSNVMAPVYAGDMFRIVGAAHLAGSVVSNTFCTTSAGSSDDDCNAGQTATVTYVNTGHNKPKIMQYVDSAGIPLFKVLSYERR